MLESETRGLRRFSFRLALAGARDAVTDAKWQGQVSFRAPTPSGNTPVVLVVTFEGADRNFRLSGPVSFKVSDVARAEVSVRFTSGSSEALNQQVSNQIVDKLLDHLYISEQIRLPASKLRCVPFWLSGVIIN